MRTRSGCVLADFPPAPSSRPLGPSGERAGAGRAGGPGPPRPRLGSAPREPNEPQLPRGVRAVMFFLPPTFESPLPPRTHSSSRHNLRAPDLRGAPRGARSACTLGRRRRPVARSVSSAGCPLSLPSFPAFAQVGYTLLAGAAPGSSPRAPRTPPTCHPNSLSGPAIPTRSRV